MDSDTPDVGRSVPRYYEDAVDEGANLYDVVFNPMPTLAEMDEQELVKASQEEDKSVRRRRLSRRAELTCVCGLILCPGDAWHVFVGSFVYGGHLVTVMGHRQGATRKRAREV
ncbi:hypothetical protein H632_c286p2 [Helicosporidium sp. ATCC 50920]|nr:hypothetical protein H632_c286p2 [Helicosporidium sp. ATCC 50920]|eukprot:KDD76280.1 hypothetical protein H632_c286p2 [Helicosporidium sp. ATCC 50920]